MNQAHERAGSPPAFAPIDADQRIQAMDVARGFALLGILLPLVRNGIVVVIIINFVTNYYMVEHYGHVGLAVAFSAKSAPRNSSRQSSYFEAGRQYMATSLPRAGSSRC